MLFVGSPAIPVALRINARAQRLTLRISSVDGNAVVTAPKKLKLREIQKFLDQQEGWLRAKMGSMPKRHSVVAGSVISLRGEPLEIVRHSGKRVILAPGKLMVPGEKPAGIAVQKFLKLRAGQEIEQLVTKYAALVGRDFTRISLRDTRSRWGSCTAAGNLMFSWRLVLAPDPILEYVVVHEVAHLVEMNHSDAFWQVVARLMPDYATPRQWLRNNGASLHSPDFGGSA